ncbi:hypothetical protein WJ74_08515 [Burkholderia ubonensis]|nr:hypothetical protein WJ74_08515 [Burkholderia ubonensis]
MTILQFGQLRAQLGHRVRVVAGDPAFADCRGTPVELVGTVREGKRLAERLVDAFASVPVSRFRVMAGQDRLTEWNHRGHLFGRGVDDPGCGACLAGACFKTRATVVLALLELVHELSPVQVDAAGTVRLSG